MIQLNPIRDRRNFVRRRPSTRLDLNQIVDTLMQGVTRLEGRKAALLR